MTENSDQPDRKIEPALTPEEWKEFRAGELHTTRLGFHATAALCLHGKPFGFTWEDVDRLRKAEIIYFIPGYGDQGRRVDERGTALLDDLADRIASLLPPRA